MADPKVRDIIQYAASGDWGIPEFQRKFEWKYEQVAKLWNSLYKDLPIGLITVWNTTRYKESQRATDYSFFVYPHGNQAELDG